MFSRQQLAGIEARGAEISQAGASLVYVGNGSPDQAQAFVEEHGLEGPVYTDPSRAIHKALGFERGLGSNLHPASAAFGVKAYLQGFRQEFVAGDPAQQGGVLVIDAAGEVALLYRSKVAGDHPSLDTVLGALRPAP